MPPLLSQTLGVGIRHRLSPLVTANGAYVGNTEDLLAWAQRTLRYKGRLGNPIVYNQMAKSEYRKWLEANPHPFAYMDVAVGSAAPQRVVFELFNDSHPMAAENFLCLCTGEKGAAKDGTKLHYEGTPLHRVVKGGWVQGGDIAGGHGDGGCSVFGPTFADESFSVKQDKDGVLVMASAEAPHTNASQFYVTLAPMPWMDRKRVAFGRVVSGMRVFRMVEKLPTVNQRPVDDVRVVACGAFPPKRKSARAGAGAGAGAGAASRKK